jgi:hypothetical protein
MLTRRTVIWAAKETTYGTDPAMSSTNSLLCYDVDLDVKGEILDRAVLRDTLSNLPHVIGIKECALTFKTEIRGPGGSLASSTPEVADLLSACGFNTGIISGTLRTYSLVSQESAMNSISVRVYLDDQNEHKICGGRGTVKFNLVAGKYAEAEWNIQGLYFAAISATTPTMSIGTTLPPICYNAGFQIGGYSPICSTAEIDLGNDVIRRDSLNATAGVQSFRLTGRKPKLSWNQDACGEGTNPNWGDWAGDIVDTFGFQVGTNAGNSIRFSGYFKYDSNKYGDQDGIRTYDCVASLVSSSTASNDELSIAFV